MRIVVGVAGGIAAYKTCEVVSRLVQSGHAVRVIETPAATKFVTPLTFRALTGDAVGVAVDDEPWGPLSHVVVSHWADALIIAPATGSLMGRLAQGLADDLLSLVYLGFKGPVIMAPAMEPDMWDHPRTQANGATLTRDGVQMVGPNQGRMASGRTGVGRMAEPSEIIDALYDRLSPQDLSGVGIVISAGPTWERFDPVRILTNPSTGRMGVLIAQQAARRGARVTLVAGPGVSSPAHRGVTVVRVESAQAMRDAVLELMAGHDVYIGAAAVSDFRPRRPLVQKAHKEELDLQWAVDRNPDIVREVAERWRGVKTIVAFAAETEDVVRRADQKRIAKGVDAVIANLVGSQQGFGDLPYQAWLVSEAGATPLEPTKEGAARQLLDWLSARLQEGSDCSR